MNKILVKTISFFVTLSMLVSSFLGLPFAYLKYENPEKYDPSLGQVMVDNDRSVPRISLIQNNSSDYVIVRGANASPAEITAAETLQDYLKQITGVALPVIPDTMPEQTKEIVVGKTNREGAATYTVDRTKLGDEGLKVFTFAEKLVIAGGEQRGTLYGVYTFLEEVLGCRWFTKDLTVILEAESVSIRRSLNIEQIPIFEFRDLSWGPAYNEAYSVAQKNNSNFTTTLTEKNGRGVTGIGLGHSFAYQLPADKYFATHPEYYALNDNGERAHTQPCLTNPDVLQIVTQSVMDSLRANPNADFISVSQNDNPHFCKCDNCKMVDEAEGSPAGSLMRFVNDVSEEVRKEFPDICVQTLIYDHTRKAPSITIPNDNVIIHICSGDSCFSHPLSDGCLKDSYGNTFAQDLEDWRKISDKIYVYDYTTNFSHYLAPHPNFGVLQENMQYFAQSNVSGVWAEGCGQLQNNGEFSHLRSYLLSKLLWDPYTDVEKHMNEFMLAYYGDGYQYIKKYIDFSGERGKINHLTMWSSPAKAVYFSATDLRKFDKWWDEAEKLAKNDFELTNLQASRIQIRYYKSFTQKCEFSKYKNIAAEGEALYNDFVRFGINRTGTGSNKLLKPREEIDFSKPIREWRVDA